MTTLPSSDLTADQALHLLRPGETLVVPVVAEAAAVERVERETGRVRVRKTLEQRTEQVPLSSWKQEARVERVARGIPADQVVAPYQDGDVWVVPVYEERWEVRKQLYLREELRVGAVRTEQRDVASVTLATERVHVERRSAAGEGWQAASEAEVRALLAVAPEGTPAAKREG